MLGEGQIRSVEEVAESMTEEVGQRSQLQPVEEASKEETLPTDDSSFDDDDDDYMNKVRVLQVDLVALILLKM